MTAESSRGFLIAEVRAFVTHVRGLPGIRRIALIGSLATAKASPKDADLLAWVDGEAEFGPLARAARQLKGKAQSLNSGADIFVVGASGDYLGRICHDRDCRLGIRMSCRARHCGSRQYICDDLDVLKLPADVIAAPPLDLWPSATVRANIPDDVRELVLTMRSMESARGSAA